MKTSHQVSIMKSATFSYFALSGWFFLLSFYALVKFLSTGNIEMLKWSLFGLVPAFICIIWTASFKIVLTEDSLTYSSLFQGTRSTKFDDIFKVDQRYVVDTSINGLNRLMIWRKDDHKNPYIAINLKMFKACDVKQLLTLLKPYASGR
jgi:hypothetical protein